MFKKYFLRHPVKTQRFLEILPGFISWSLILFPVWGSFVVPMFVAYYVIVFVVYWAYKSLVMAIMVILSHFKIKAISNFDWISDLNKNYGQEWRKVHHITIIPSYKEPLYILQRTLDALVKQSVGGQQLHVMLSFEEREGQPAKDKAIKLKKQYHDKFGHFWTTFHPDIEDEVKGKSSNTCWGAKIAKRKLVDEAGYDINHITITSEDADACFHQHYFANLTYEFLSSDNRDNFIWQGALVFYNNIWDVPAPIRIVSSMCSVSQMNILMRQDRLINISTYSATLKHADEIGYWDTDVIPEDYRFFFKSYFAKHGNFRVKPIFLPIYADAPRAENFFSTLKNQYQQVQRWAWGVSDDAYIIRNYVMSDAPFWDKTLRVLGVIEDHFLWPVHWMAITVSASLPPLLNPDFNRTLIGKTLPQVTSTLLTLVSVSLIILIIIDALNRPPRPKDRKILSYILQPIEFVMLPVLGFFFTVLPGIDAHTRLMLGRYIEYKVTKKV